VAQIFHPSFNGIARYTLLAAILGAGALAWVGVTVNRSSYATQVNMPREQPVPFSHKHHVAGLGIDCRYCHTSVEVSSFAGIPPTRTCMNCHSQIWTEAPLLEPVRDSWKTGRSLEWTRVHDLPGFTYFNHAIHVKRGVACVTCHGRVDEMPITWQTNTLYMEWCLECHRSPERFVGPRADVFKMQDVTLTPERLARGRELVQSQGIRRLENCSTCHR
jgi:hypothetical protein